MNSFVIVRAVRSFSEYYFTDCTTRGSPPRVRRIARQIGSPTDGDPVRRGNLLFHRRKLPHTRVNCAKSSIRSFGCCWILAAGATWGGCFPFRLVQAASVFPAAGGVGPWAALAEGAAVWGGGRLPLESAAGSGHVVGSRLMMLVFDYKDCVGHEPGDINT